MDTLLEIIQKFKGRIIGALIGLVFAILLLTLGFWRTFLIVLLMGTGTGIGFFFDDRLGFQNSIGEINKKLKKDE